MCCGQTCCGCDAISPLCIGKLFAWLLSAFVGAELDPLVPAAANDNDDDDDAAAAAVDADVDVDAADDEDAAVDVDADVLGPATPLADGSSAILLSQPRHPKFWLVLPESWRICLGCMGALIISRNLRSCEQRFAEFPCELLNIPFP